MARFLGMSHIAIVLSCVVLVIVEIAEGTSSSEEQANRRCRVDKYYDEFTRNCEACSLLCEVARDTMKECEQKCEDYLTILQRQTTTPVYRLRHGHQGGQGHGRGEAVRVDNVQIATQLSAINDSLRGIFYAILALTAVATVAVIGGCFYLLQARRKRLDEESCYNPLPHQPPLALQVEPPEEENVRDHPEGGEEAAETNPSLPVQNASRCPSHNRLNVEDALRNQQAHDEGRRSSAESDV
ncbi:Hypp2681 [Branchiostoma lanceolatum]|uniref:Hypp2681 protein n=1 Tax=Branchiostoma lanceolatum TaxID=7740 RepID=A0A8J9ZWA3_BRALA|nr:Hypp2681 [Branchiostoma lanceolatum]